MHFTITNCCIETKAMVIFHQPSRKFYTIFTILYNFYTILFIFHSSHPAGEITIVVFIKQLVSNLQKRF